MKYYDLKTTFGFGKYKDKTLLEVYASDPSYVDWCLREVKGFSILRNTFNKLINERNYNFSEKSLNSIIDNNKKSVIDDQDFEGSYSRPDYELAMEIKQHPILEGRSDINRLLDEADAIGCDPEDLISNLE